MYIYIHINLFICINRYIHICDYFRAHAVHGVVEGQERHIHVCAYVYVYIYVYICIYIHTHASTLTHSRTHIHTLTEDGEEDERNIMGTDCLQKFARAVGVEVAPEPGLMVLRRRAAPGRAWAVENLIEEV